ncbi:disease resistance protein At4g27190-like [Tasmannia lanceolata]|uniref:disease resistance protein At4g27190-like n=1 Tax=Tasmannia lanceolata TaxID=3420 RepID=UPI004062A1AB
MSSSSARRNTNGIVFERVKQRIWEFLRADVGSGSHRTCVVVREATKTFHDLVTRVTKRALRQVMKEAEESHLFHFTVWVPAVGDVSDRHSLMEKIGAQLVVGTSHFVVRQMLRQQRYLLILDDVFMGIESTDSLWPSEYNTWSKFVIVTPTSPTEIPVLMEEKWECLSEEDAWDLLSQEAIHMAADLSRVEFNFSGDTIMKCWVICLLFPYPLAFSYLICHWIVKGYIIGFERVEEDGLSLCGALITGLSERFMLEGSYHYNLPRGIADKLISVAGEATRGAISHGHIFLVRCNLELTQPPKGEEWQDKEMISLSSNQISSLSYVAHPPLKCPTLTTLLLDHNPLDKIPDSFFEHMNNLQVLDLSSTSISSLPSSLSCLTNLGMLSLNDCPCLQTLPMPQIQGCLTKLQFLNFQNTPIKSQVPKASFEDMPNLRSLDFYVTNASAITHFSVRGCSSLENLRGLEALVNLQMLDLSGTKIKELPVGISQLINNLTRLDLIDLKYLKNVQWNKICRLPKELNWDHCYMNLARESREGDSEGYCIAVNDAEVFLHLYPDSPLWVKYFQKFHFYVCAYEERCMDKDDPYVINQTYYGDVFAQIKTEHSDPSTNYNKCFEIYTSNSPLYGIKGVLNNTEFFRVHDNQFITTLSELDVKTMSKMVECRIEKCREMKNLLSASIWGNNDVFPCLKKLWVYHLTKATSVFTGIFGRETFTLLNSIHLESCPKLVNLFSSGICFEKLEILEIRFCDRLETVFLEDQAGQHAFPLLRTLCLWELPKLKIICNGYLPVLEKLKTKGCLELHNLPLHIGNQNAALEISGEANWWKNLVLEDSIKNRIRFREQRPFTL